MATSYKIRLKRFNGVDYDTLNLSSDNIIMSNGDSLENAFQSLFPSSDGIIKNDNGEFVIATKGTDYGALSFTVTLTVVGWSSNAQTVSNANFIASGYSYIVSPASGSFTDYGSAQIYADDVTVAGQMTFHCTDAPSTALTVNITRVVSA